MSEYRNEQSAEILGSVYRNAEMAYEASGDVLRRCPNRRLAGEKVPCDVEGARQRNSARRSPVTCPPSRG